MQTAKRSAADVETSDVISGAASGDWCVSDSSSSSGNDPSAAMTELSGTAPQAASDLRCKLAGRHIFACSQCDISASGVQ